MKKVGILYLFLFFVAINSRAQLTKSGTDNSSQDIQDLIQQQQERAKIDSIIKFDVQEELLNAKDNSNEKDELQQKLNELERKDSVNKAKRKERISLLKQTAVAYPVVLFHDTLLNIYLKTGSFTAKERADAITSRIRKLYEADFFSTDSLIIATNERSADLVHCSGMIILSVSDLDAMMLNTSVKSLSEQYKETIGSAVLKYREQNSISNLINRYGKIAVIVVCLILVILLINKLFKRSENYLITKQEMFLNGITIKKFKLFNPVQHRKFVLRSNNFLRIVVIFLLIYLSLPLMFSIFPETKAYTNTLIGWILSPAKRTLHSFISFLPNLFTILVIYFITRWAIRVIKFFFAEIESGTIVFNGFHKDWAMPTFNILKIILYAFMLVVIFPYLPGSDSPAFQGVSVFLGVLFSLGSSSAITNIVAGMVITYMRPFRVGDRVKIGEVVGDVIEKNMLVTRIRTNKNEDITVPNSSVLSSHTINYSSNVEGKGLIMHTTVTIGYDVPWKNMHQALIDAALRTTLILKDPQPFVLQTSLEDFYVSYQINAYTKEANKLALIYSELHQNIQDCCNEAGIEIMSPHYAAMRDGNQTSIPADYLSKEYTAPPFNVNINKKEY